MIVLDTHAWIYFAADPAKLGKAASRALKSAKRIGVPAISLWELTMLVEKRRITLDRDLREWIAAALSDRRLEVLPMTPPVVLAAHQLRGALDGDPGDRLIAATAFVESASLVTKDERITKSGAVPTIW